MGDNSKKLNTEQKNTLVDFMQVNYVLLFGKFGNSDGKVLKEKKWQEIVDELNKLGPQKDVDKWKKTWLGLKNEVKKKYKQKRQNENQTGAAPINITFTDLDDRISAIVGKQLMDGDECVSEIGFAGNWLRFIL